MLEFSYQEMWKLEEPMQKPHNRKAEELGVSFTDVPVSPTLTRLSESLRRIEELYNVFDLEEEQINVRELLSHYTEIQVISLLEEMGLENAITFAEVESLLFCDDWKGVMQIQKINSDFFLLRQFEDVGNGRFVDMSAFNTMDFIRGVGNWEFDNYRYFTDKLAERVEDLAIMYSCITNSQGKENVRDKYVSLVDNKFRNYALRLANMMKDADEDRKAELMEKINERNRQIKRLRTIWNKYAYWE